MCALVLATPCSATAQTSWYGPLTTEEGSPLQRLSYTPMTEAADPVARGAFRTDVWLGFSNVFERDSADAYLLYFDMERLISAATVRYGLADGLEIGGRVTLETTGGGGLDDFLTWWHGVLHVGNADRERYPSGIYSQRLEDQGGQVRIDVPRRTLALEDVRLFAKFRLYSADDASSLLSLRAVTRLPTERAQVGRERADLALMVLGRASWTRWHVHGQVSRTSVRASPELEDLLKSSGWFASLSVERRVWDSVSAVVQYSLANARITGFDSRKIGSPLGNFVFGAAGRLGEAWRWDIGVQEDMPAVSPAIDFTLGIRLSRTW